MIISHDYLYSEVSTTYYDLQKSDDDIGDDGVNDINAQLHHYDGSDMMMMMMIMK